jgi:hypothetical protein
MVTKKARDATAAETAGAMAFVKELGGDPLNYLLDVAVVAWLHQESGGLNGVVGNNPFNLRPGQDIAGLSNGSRHMRRNGAFATFATMALGFEAAARRLKTLTAYYGLVVKAAQRPAVGQKDQLQVAVDFLYAIAMSPWDIAHYGLVHGQAETNHLLGVFSTFTGLTLPATKLPAAVVAAVKTVVATSKNAHGPGLPATAEGPLPYMGHDRSQAFYQARHQRPHVVKG